jgi:thioredoxin-like negative regulator of GroEL
MEILTSANIAEFCEDSPLAFIVFYAKWHKECPEYLGKLRTFEELNPDIKFGMIDIDDEQEIARAFKVTVVPTTVTYKDGSLNSMDVGNFSLDQLDTAANTLRTPK